MANTKLNERVWAGHVISWIKEAIQKDETIFQEATNDEGIKAEGKTTKFPDVLLFLDKISGIIFNGWELKFPDTAVDDHDLLVNALEKAKLLKSDSFVTWNGRTAIIWKINDGLYSIDRLSKLMVYPEENEIITRNDLAIWINYQKNEQKLKARLFQILKDLESFYKNGNLKEAINISSEIHIAVSECSRGLVPQFIKEIIKQKNENQQFRIKFNEWKILESSTIQILNNSSRKVEHIDPEEILAKFVFYKLIGKIIFYSTLSETLSSKLENFSFTEAANLKTKLDHYFREASKIDYQAIFEIDFTDEICYNNISETVLLKFFEVITKFDFKVLPNNVIGNILQHLVPDDEKQKFGQYFTPEKLAYMVSFPGIKNQNYYIFDPTSGTGTFLDASYNILSYFGLKDHQKKLSQIWGNDISHFPAVLSVINLYKQKIRDLGNFPRVTRKNYFDLKPGQIIQIPDNVEINRFIDVKIPLFDAIVCNFPFIQQEDIPKVDLVNRFENEFKKTQSSFFESNKFIINERSDYYTYCFYNSLKFLKPAGYLSAITSNAWLGKEYGLQFKKFLLDNFSIKYIVKSNAEHWFKNSFVSTIYIVLQKTKSNAPTKFVTINKKFDDLFPFSTKNELINGIDDFYNQIDYCDDKRNPDWELNGHFPKVYSKKDGSLRVSIVSREVLERSIIIQDNWAEFFLAENYLIGIEDKLLKDNKEYFTNGRGTRTGQDKFFYLDKDDILNLGLENELLTPIILNSQELLHIHHNSVPQKFAFICNKNEKELQEHFPNAFGYIKGWENKKNKIGEPLKTVLGNKFPFWYSLSLEDRADIFISINPNKRLFFSYSDEPCYLNQRLVAIRTKKEDKLIIAALLNSIITLLNVELTGVSRNLGALDLNANFFKERIRILNPGLLTPEQKERIIDKFKIVAERNVLDVEQEVEQIDRMDFDKEVFNCYGLDDTQISFFYSLLLDLVNNRIQMKNK